MLRCRTNPYEYSVLALCSWFSDSNLSTLTGAGLINLSIRGWTIVGTIGLILLYVGWTKGDKLQKRFLGFLDRYLSPAQKPHGD